MTRWLVGLCLAAMPLFSATIPIYNGAVGMGLGNDDTAAVCAVLEAMAGVERGQ